jgi:hypothetical protein
MSDLQLALLVLGAFVIAGVVAYNFWQEKRVRERAERAFGRDHPDVLFDSAHGRREPTLGALPEAAPAAPPAIAEEPSVFEAEAGVTSVISSRIDTVAVILADDPVPRESLDPLLDALERHTTPVNVEGIVDEQWQPIDLAQRQSWRELRAGLQLASRSGPLPEEEIAAFNETMAGFAASMNAVSQRESPAAAAARARELDRFCAETDVEVAINVVGQFGATFAIARVKEIALGHGLSENASGDLVKFASDASVEFVVRRFAGEGSYATGLSLALDLPHAADAPGALSDMVALAEIYASTLGGELVDDNRKPLTAPGIAAIRRQVEGVVRDMEAHGIPAGSALARRLFS